MATPGFIEGLSKFYRRLFMLDGAGALTSAFLLGVVLVRFEEIFGIPHATLYFLATLPIFFFLFDLWCFLKPARMPFRQLKTIAFINLGYCIISLSLALYHLDSLSIFGWAYILSEVGIVATLAIIELKVAASLKAQSAQV